MPTDLEGLNKIASNKYLKMSFYKGRFPGETFLPN